MTIDFHPTAPRPVEETEPVRDSRETNPMFNDQRMKLGLFGTNCSYGLVMSHAPSTYEVTWEHTREIARRADALNEYTEVKSVWVELTGATRDPFKLG